MSEENIHGNIQGIEIEQEMKKSYLAYAMSVIAGRALPDVRDGLKPVHRRILYAMHDMGLSSESGYRKCANVTGEVLGKYHPHGESAVYDTLVKMAQDFSQRYPLIDGQGNFGSIDGDPAAAPRYTESKMQKITAELLRDIDKETVPFRPNYDERQMEPVVLPAKYPNLLVNGSNGIAVGMATSIPPHNLREVINAVLELIENPQADTADFLRHIKGPDFPTGAIILGKKTMAEAYESGRGKFTVRAKTDIEELPNGKSQIIVTEIPYQVNKARLVEKIADLVKEKRVEGITALRDESNRKGMRIVIELRRDINPTIMLNHLYKHSQLQDVYSLIMLALVDGKPKILSLKEMLTHYLNHQKSVIKNRTLFELKKAQERLHILEGLRIALDHIEQVIALIRASEREDVAQDLMDTFGLSDLQANAILSMQLRRLSRLERDKIDQEHQSLLKNAQYLQSVLDDESILLGIIRQEITAIRDKYGDKRRTQIIDAPNEINMRDMIPDEDVSITLTHYGYLKRLPLDTYKTQHRGGKGITSMTKREEDFVEKLIMTSNHAKILFLTSKGRMFHLNAYEIPQTGRTARGINIVNLLSLEKEEKVTAILPIKETPDEHYLVMCTQKGQIKKTKIGEFRKSSRNGLIAMSLKVDDALISARITDGEQKFMIVTKKGMAILFEESQVRDMGRSAMGVKGISLNKDDQVIAMEIYKADLDLLVISEKGYGKRTALSSYTPQSRGGKGVKCYKVGTKTGQVAGARIVRPDEELMIINSDGTLIRLDISQISQLSRNTSGVRVMRVEGEHYIASIAPIEASDISVESLETAKE